MSYGRTCKRSTRANPGVQVEYHLGGFPQARVINPDIRSLAGDRKIPHLYNEVGDPLCLFYAPAREWNSAMSMPHDRRQHRLHAGTAALSLVVIREVSEGQQ